VVAGPPLPPPLDVPAIGLEPPGPVPAVVESPEPFELQALAAVRAKVMRVSEHELVIARR
jgi:hypothetical protein